MAAGSRLRPGTKYFTFCEGICPHIINILSKVANCDLRLEVTNCDFKNFKHRIM